MRPGAWSASWLLFRIAEAPDFDPRNQRLAELPSRKVTSTLQNNFDAFTSLMDAAEAELAPLRAFVLPAGTAKAAAFHLARTICRRAERNVVTLSHSAEVHELFIIYLNRLSDLLFTLARLANHREGRGDVTW